MMSEAVQDGEESSRGSESPSSAREELLSPRRPQATGDRVSSINCPGSPASAVLSSRELWQLFDAIGTEMIVTRRGRRMFPAIKVELYDLKPDVSYILLMDMAPVDKYRYKYNAGWVRCFEEECAPTRLYIHPDSPALGSHWTSVVINFYKLKLTNNQLDKQGHIIVNSMHRYQPRLHIVESDDINSFNWETRQTFIFLGTQFTTVTAYQNDKITQLKIQTNPFAKGFRTPFSRCRSRNPPGTCPRFNLRSGSYSDSGVEDPPHSSPTSLSHSSPTSLFSPKLLFPTHDSSHILLHDSARVLVQGQEMAAAQRVLLPGWDLSRLLVPEQEGQQQVLLAAQDGSPIVLQGQNGKTHFVAGQEGQRMMLAGQESSKLLVAGHNYQKLVLPAQHTQSSPAQQEAQVVRLVVTPDGQKLLLPAHTLSQKEATANFVVGQQEGQKVVNGQTFLLQGQDSRQMIVLGAGDRTHSVLGKRMRQPEESVTGRKVPCLSAPKTEAPVVLMYQPVMVASQQSPRTILPSRGPSPTTYTVRVSTQQETSCSTSQPQVSTAHPTSFLHTLTPHTSPPPTSTNPTVVNGLVHLKSADIKTRRPAMDISCLTKEGVARSKTPPALLQVEDNRSHSPSPSTEQSTSEEPAEQPSQADSGQDVVLIPATPPSGVQRVLVIGEKGETATSQPQMVLPVAYDQQLVSMPIYRVGSSLGGLQLLASLPSGTS